jgi:aminoglycoside phosphotransferase family enzyme/predicted kinase
MEWQQLVSALESPEAYPGTPETIEVRHTHISVVYLADEIVYKIKKPVDLGFLDFSDPKDREFFCHEEVRLNSRMAPGVYLGVVPVALGADGKPHFEGEGEVLHWAVKMKRLPDDATLSEQMKADKLSGETFAALGRRIAAFHAEAETNDEIAQYGSFDNVAFVSRENFEQAEPHIGTTLTRAVWERLVAGNERQLVKFKELIDRRAEGGMTRETHGDLHLDHVYYFPQKTAPDDLVALDCIEFSPAYRCTGCVVNDMAFMCMDLLFRGKADWMTLFAEAYFAASGDDEGRALLPFYIAYRAAVRGKVEGMAAVDENVPAPMREEMGAKARARWLVALGQLEEPQERPALVLTCGQPGSGKSRLAHDLVKELGFTGVVSDRVRKELAGLDPEQSGKAAFGEGIYTPEWNERTYGECLKRAEDLLLEGKRVVIDASFREDAKRADFVALAEKLGVPCHIMVRTAPDEAIKARLDRRKDDNVSDADWQISREAARLWEGYSEKTAPLVAEVRHMETKEMVLDRAVEILKEAGLA